MVCEAVIGLLTGLPEQHAPLLWAKADGWLGLPASPCQHNGDDAATNGTSLHLPDEQVIIHASQFYQGTVLSGADVTGEALLLLLVRHSC